MNSSILVRRFSVSCPVSKRAWRPIPGNSNPAGKSFKPSKYTSNKIFSPYIGTSGSPYVSEEVKVNFRGLRFFQKRHLPEHKKMLFKPFEQRSDQWKYLEEHKYGTRGTGIRHEHAWEHIPEKVPELIVPPDLKESKLRPYVSYKNDPLPEAEFTSQDLFYAIYAKKINKDYKEGTLDEQGKPLEPSDLEKLSPEQAWVLARQTGSDIFQGGVEPSKEWKIKWDRK